MDVPLVSPARAEVLQPVWGTRGEWSLWALDARGRCWSDGALSRSVCIGSVPGPIFAVLGVL